MYQYDIFGWYCGRGDGQRTTAVEPQTLSVDSTPGAPRANWTGREWVVLPYVAQVAPSAAGVSAPQSVTPRQARLALLQAGLLDDVEAALEAIEDVDTRRVAQIEWQTAQQIERDWPLLVQVAAAAGLTPERIDELFVTAAGL